MDRGQGANLAWMPGLQTTGWAPPAGLTNTSSSSNLVFSGGVPSRYWPDSALLSFSLGLQGDLAAGYCQYSLKYFQNKFDLILVCQRGTLHVSFSQVLILSTKFSFISSTWKNCVFMNKKIENLRPNSIWHKYFKILKIRKIHFMQVWCISRMKQGWMVTWRQPGTSVAWYKLSPPAPCSSEILLLHCRGKAIHLRGICHAMLIIENHVWIPYNYTDIFNKLGYGGIFNCIYVCDFTDLINLTCTVHQ